MIYTKSYEIKPTPKTKWQIFFYINKDFEGNLFVGFNTYRRGKSIEKNMLSKTLLAEIKRLEPIVKKEFLQWCCKSLDIQV